MIIRSAITGLTWHCLSILHSNSKKGSYSINTAEFSLLAFGILTAIWSRPTQKLFKEVRKMFLKSSISDTRASQAILEMNRIFCVDSYILRGLPGAERFKKRTERELRASRHNFDHICEIHELTSRSEIRRFNSHFSRNPLQNIFWPFFCLRNFLKIKKQVPFPKIDSPGTEALVKEAFREPIEVGRGRFSTSTNGGGRREEQLNENCSFVGEEILNRLQPIVLRQQAKIREILNCYRDREELERELMPGNFDQNEPHLEEMPANTS